MQAEDVTLSLLDPRDENPSRMHIWTRETDNDVLEEAFARLSPLASILEAVRTSVDDALCLASLTPWQADMLLQGKRCCTGVRFRTAATHPNRLGSHWAPPSTSTSVAPSATHQTQGIRPEGPATKGSGRLAPPGTLLAFPRLEEARLWPRQRRERGS